MKLKCYKIPVRFLRFFLSRIREILHLFDVFTRFHEFPRICEVGKNLLKLKPRFDDFFVKAIFRQFWRFFLLFTGEQKILHLTTEQEKDKTHFTDKETGVELELEESMPFLEWLANNYKSFGATLEIITDRSQEGSQFVRGFGGIGGMLRYKVDFQAMQCDDFDEEEFDLDDY